MNDLIPSAESVNPSVPLTRRRAFFFVSISAVIVISLFSVFSTQTSNKNDGKKNPKTIKAAATNCSLRVALAIDRSSSIGADYFGGSVASINATRDSASALIDAIQGPDSYMDVYAFGSQSIRINAVPDWFRLNNATNVNLQKFVIAAIPFKYWTSGPYTGDNARKGWNIDYNDALDPTREGSTNWDGAINHIVGSTVGSGREWPTHIIMFTDGNPTVTQAETDAAINGNAAAQNQLFQGTMDGHELPAAVNSANIARSYGIQVIPVGVGGGVNVANLTELAGGGPVYHASNFGGLTAQFQQVVNDINNTCTTTTTTTQPPTPISAGISLSASPSSGDIVEDSERNVSFTLTNTGSATLKNVTVHSYSGIIDCNSSPSGGTIFKDYSANVAPGHTREFFHTVKIDLGHPSSYYRQTYCAYGEAEAVGYQVVVAPGSARAGASINFNILRIPLPN